MEMHPGGGCAFDLREDDLLIFGTFDVSKEEDRRIDLVVDDDLRGSVDRDQVRPDSVIDRIGSGDRRSDEDWVGDERSLDRSRDCRGPVRADSSTIALSASFSFAVLAVVLGDRILSRIVGGGFRRRRSVCGKRVGSL